MLTLHSYTLRVYPGGYTGLNERTFAEICRVHIALNGCSHFVEVSACERAFICRGGATFSKQIKHAAATVSYTHLTLPTIYSV